METPVIRKEVQLYLKACVTFADFSRYIMTRYNEVRTAERKAIGTQMPGLNFSHTPPLNDAPLAATLSNLPPID